MLVQTMMMAKFEKQLNCRELEMLQLQLTAVGQGSTGSSLMHVVGNNTSICEGAANGAVLSSYDECNRNFAKIFCGHWSIEREGGCGKLNDLRNEYFRFRRFHVNGRQAFCFHESDVYKFAMTMKPPIYGQLRGLLSQLIFNWFRNNMETHPFDKFVCYQFLKAVYALQIVPNFAYFVASTPTEVQDVWRERQYWETLSARLYFTRDGEGYVLPLFPAIAPYFADAPTTEVLLRVACQFFRYSTDTVVLMAVLLSQAMYSGFNLETVVQRLVHNRRSLPSNVVHAIWTMCEIAMSLVGTELPGNLLDIALADETTGELKFDHNVFFRQQPLIMERLLESVPDQKPTEFSKVYAYSQKSLSLEWNLDSDMTFWIASEDQSGRNDQWLTGALETTSRPKLANWLACLDRRRGSESNTDAEMIRGTQAIVQQLKLIPKTIAMRFVSRHVSGERTLCSYQLLADCFGTEHAASIYLYGTSDQDRLLALNANCQNWYLGAPYEHVVLEFEKAIAACPGEERLHLNLAKYIDMLIHSGDTYPLVVWEKCAISYCIATTLYTSLDYPIVVRLLTVVLGVFKTSPNAIHKFLSECMEILPHAIKYQLRSSIFYVMSLTRHKSALLSNFNQFLVSLIVTVFPNTVAWHGLCVRKKSGSCAIDGVFQSQSGLLPKWLFYKRFADDLCELQRAKDSDVINWLVKRKEIDVMVCAPFVRYFSLKSTAQDESSYEFIVGFSHLHEVMKSLQKPVKLWITLSNGLKAPALCKFNDELRKDNRILDYFEHFEMVSSGKLPKGLLRTYAAMPITDAAGIIEWIDGSETMRSIIQRYLRRHNLEINVPQARQLLSNGSSGLKQLLLNLPSMLHHFYLEQFRGLDEWHRAKTAFVTSAAITSLLGYFVGLGDRHTENIMIDVKSGGVIHVDFSCLFDRAKSFEVPECVPFRMTHNMTRLIGTNSQEQKFNQYAIHTAASARKNAMILSGLLDALVHDPITDIRKSTVSACDEASFRAFINERMNGQYGDNNRTDIDLVFCHELWKQATDPERLSRMYFGWAPFM